MPSDLVYIYAAKYSLNPLDLEIFVQSFGFGYAHAAQCSFDGNQNINRAIELDAFFDWIHPSTNESCSTYKAIFELCQNNHDVVKRCAQFLAENWQDIEDYEKLLGASTGFKFALIALQCDVSFLDPCREKPFRQLEKSARIINEPYSSIVEGITVYLDDEGIYRIMLGQGERQEPVEFEGRLA